MHTTPEPQCVFDTFWSFQKICFETWIISNLTVVLSEFWKTEPRGSVKSLFFIIFYLWFLVFTYLFLWGLSCWSRSLSYFGFVTWHCSLYLTFLCHYLFNMFPTHSLGLLVLELKRTCMLELLTLLQHSGFSGLCCAFCFCFCFLSGSCFGYFSWFSCKFTDSFLSWVKSTGDTFFIPSILFHIFLWFLLAHWDSSSVPVCCPSIPLDYFIYYNTPTAQPESL